MDTQEIRDAIALEIQRLTAAHAALNGDRPRKTRATRYVKPKRTLSAAAKKRISAAAKARWAAAKKQGKNQL